MRLVEASAPVIGRPSVVRARRVLERFGAVDGGLLAAGIAYNAAFALLPLALLVAAIAGFIVTDPDSQRRFIEAVVSFAPPLAGVVDEIVDGVGRHCVGQRLRHRCPIRRTRHRHRHLRQRPRPRVGSLRERSSRPVERRGACLADELRSTSRRCRSEGDTARVIGLVAGPPDDEPLELDVPGGFERRGNPSSGVGRRVRSGGHR